MSKKIWRIFGQELNTIQTALKTWKKIEEVMHDVTPNITFLDTIAAIKKIYFDIEIPMTDGLLEI